MQIRRVFARPWWRAQGPVAVAQKNRNGILLCIVYRQVRHAVMVEVAHHNRIDPVQYQQVCRWFERTIAVSQKDQNHRLTDHLDGL